MQRVSQCQSVRRRRSQVKVESQQTLTTKISFVSARKSSEQIMTESKYKPVTHCIFDMDGLTIDSEKLYTELFNDIVGKYGKTFTWEHKAMTMGFHTREAAAKIVEVLELPMSVDEFVDEWVKRHEIFTRCQLMPDSELVYKQIYKKIVGEFGFEYGGAVAYEVLGRPEKVGFDIIIDHYNLPITAEHFGQKYRSLQIELFTDVKLMPGAERLFKHLKAHNVPFALATSSSKESYELKTKKLQETFDLFHHKVFGGSDPEVTKGKPNPDIFLVAAARFPEKPDPSKCLVFEDAPNGVLAALAAGMQCVMVPDPLLPENMINKDVTLKLNSLEEFKPELFGLPKFDD